MGATINKAYKFFVRTTTGKTDLYCDIQDPSGNKVSMDDAGTTTSVDSSSTSTTNPFTISYTEGHDGIYTFAFTPVEAGMYFIRVRSTSITELDVKGGVECQVADIADVTGTGFNSANDGMHRISEIIADVAAVNDTAGEIIVL